MKKLIIIVVIIIVVLIGLAVLRGDEDTWICVKGKWIRHGNPSTAMPAPEKCLFNN